MNDNELYHYGVLGMKWGVRRNTRLLANKRRNSQVQKIKKQYDLGNIDSSQKKAAIKKANTTKKSTIDNTKQKLKNMNTKEEISEYHKSIKRQTIQEVSNYRLKNGAAVVNQVLYGTRTASRLGSALFVSTTAPPLAPMVLTAAGIDQLADKGITTLIQRGILDKLS